MQLPQERLNECYNTGHSMIWQYKTLYQVNHSHAQGIYYLTLIRRKPVSSAVGVTLKGRYMAMTPEEASKY